MNGYTEININGKSVGIMFGMYANRVFAERKQNDKYYTGDSLNEMGIAALLYAGYLNQCVLDDAKDELQLRDFSVYVEEQSMSGDTSEITKAVEVWTQSHFIQKSIEKMKVAKDEIKKKKQTGTRSKKSPSVK